MAFELFTNPNLVREVKKFLRVEKTIYIGPVDSGHQDIADHFQINRSIKTLKINQREEVDGGFIEVNNMELSVEFESASGTYGLDFHQSAREGSVLAGQELCPGYGVYFKEIEDNQAAFSSVPPKSTLNIEYRESYSFYSTSDDRRP